MIANNLFLIEKHRDYMPHIKFKMEENILIFQTVSHYYHGVCTSMSFRIAPFFLEEPVKVYARDKV